MTRTNLRTPLRLFAISTFGAVLTGCAATVYEGKYDWNEGWRKAEVVAVQTAAEMERPRFFTCVRQASPEQLATTRFAVVKYREMSRTQRRAIPLQPGDSAAIGESVYIKVGDCQAALVHRAGQLKTAR